MLALGETPQARDTYSMARLRVMVVEDDDFTRSTVVSALQIQGIDVVGQSSSVSPAMVLFNELKPDAVVLEFLRHHLALNI